MENLYVFTNPDENITQTHVSCFIQQLLQDAESQAAKLRWDHDRTTTKIGVYVSNGLNPDSKIKIETYPTPKEPAILISYSQKGRLMFTAFEFCGNPTDARLLLPLYKKVASVVHKNAPRTPIIVQRRIKIE